MFDFESQVDQISENFLDLLVSVNKLKENLPDAIAEGILRKEAQHCIVLHGVPEFTAADFIGSIFAVGCINQNDYRILCRLGRAGIKHRPIKVQLCQGIYPDFLSEWNSKLQQIPRLSRVRIKKFLTQLQLQEKRDAAQVPDETAVFPENLSSEKNEQAASFPGSKISKPSVWSEEQNVTESSEEQVAEGGESLTPAELFLKLLVEKLKLIRIQLAEKWAQKRTSL